MKLWVDDERPMPKGYDQHVRTAQEAIQALKTGLVETISLDHDLGPAESGTGYYVAKYIEEAAIKGELVPIKHMRIHTSNPVGRRNIAQALQNAARAWDSPRDS